MLMGWSRAYFTLKNALFILVIGYAMDCLHQRVAPTTQGCATTSVTGPSATCLTRSFCGKRASLAGVHVSQMTACVCFLLLYHTLEKMQVNNEGHYTNAVNLVD